MCETARLTLADIKEELEASATEDNDAPLAAIYLIKNLEHEVNTLRNFLTFPWWRRNKYGWPIELTRGRWAQNALRIIFQNMKKLST